MQQSTLSLCVCLLLVQSEIIQTIQSMYTNENFNYPLLESGFVKTILYPLGMAIMCCGRINKDAKILHFINRKQIDSCIF